MTKVIFREKKQENPDFEVGNFLLIEDSIFLVSDCRSQEVSQIELIDLETGKGLYHSGTFSFFAPETITELKKLLLNDNIDWEIINQINIDFF